MPQQSTEALTLDPAFPVRAMVPNDRAFVVQTWFDSYRSTALTLDSGGMHEMPGCRLARVDASSAYLSDYKRLIQALVDRSEVRIAHDLSDRDALVGFVVFEPNPLPVLHYVFVRQEGRRIGIARRLLGDLTRQAVLFTHRIPRSNLARVPGARKQSGTPEVVPFILPPLWRYNPYRTQA